MSKDRSSTLRAIVAVITAALLGTAVNAQSDGLTSLKTRARAERVETICHATGSNKNPYVSVTASDTGSAHGGHDGDIIPAPAAGCPAGEGTNPTANPEPVTMLLLGVGLSGIAYVARRRKAQI